MIEVELIRNLVAAAKEHQARCESPECGVSLYLLQLAAKSIRSDIAIMNGPDVWRSVKKADQLIAEMPI